MNDYIKKEEATSIPVIPKEHRKHFNNLDDAFETGWNEALTCVNMIPNADVIEVVRCKDCKWWTKQEDSLQGRCALLQMYPTGTWYCADGERKEHEYRQVGL